MVKKISISVCLVCLTVFCFSKPPKNIIDYKSLMIDSTSYKKYLSDVVISHNFCQTDTSNIVYNADVNPGYKGGSLEMAKFIGMNIKYPSLARKMEVVGKVLVKFVVNESGEICNLEVIKYVGYGLDEEAIRVMSLFNKWIPAKKNGKNVKTYFKLPISFSLSSSIVY